MSWTNANRTPSGGDETNETKVCLPTDARSSAGDPTMSAYRLIIDVYLVGTLSSMYAMHHGSNNF